jgi:3-deoxy-D-manno-octulosonate 8-phosphate phosphatase (KDO 8-P phosphatase)
LVKENACIITDKKGGHGAVREVCDFILKAQDNYETAMAKYLV